MSDSWTPPNTEHPPPKAGEPPLHAAARVGDATAIRAIVEQGADIDEFFDIQLDPDGREWLATPLMIAAGSGDGATIETVRVLLELGADPERKTEYDSAATVACKGLGWNYRPGGDADRLRLLLQHGAPLPQSPSDLNALLCAVASRGDADLVRAVLEHGAAPDGHWDREEAAQMHDAIEKMAQDCKMEEDSPLGAMIDSARDEYDEVIQRYEEEWREQQLSAPSSFEIPLFCAAGSGNAECVRAILDAGADPTLRDNSRRTAMYSATSTEVMRVLMEAGLSVEDEDEYEWSPLVNAIRDGEDGIPIVRALIECGADVNRTHDRGYTAFMSAVGSGRYPEVLRLLVAAGANPHAVTELGYNAFHAAIDVSFEANEEASVRSTFSYLRELGVDIEHRNGNGLTPLARAIEYGNGTEVRVLCQLGADANAVCPVLRCKGDTCTNIDTPLLTAAVSSAVQADQKVESMLTAGADPLVKDAEGFTPLVRAISRVCSNADDYRAACVGIHKALHRARETVKGDHSNRDEYIAEALPVIDCAVRVTAAEIPVPDGSEFEPEWREARVRCIVLLGAYEGWTLRQAGPSAP